MMILNAIFFGAVIGLFWIGYYILYWFHFLRHLPDERREAGRSRTKFGAGVALVVIFGIGTVMVLWLPKSWLPKIAYYFLPLLCLNVTVPAFLNFILVQGLKKSIANSRLDPLIFFSIAVLPLLDVILVGFAFAIDPMAHPDIPFFAVLYTGAQLHFIGIWLLYRASLELMSGIAPAMHWRKRLEICFMIIAFGFFVIPIIFYLTL